MMFRVIDGEIIFFPFGRFGGGYVVDPHWVDVINKINSRYLRVGFFIFVLVLLTRSAWDVLPLVAFLTIYCFHFRGMTKKFKRSSARITTADLLAANSQEMSFGTILAFLALPAFFVVFFSFVTFALWKMNVWMSVVDLILVAIFVFGVGQFTVILITKIRYNQRQRRASRRKAVS